MTARTPTSAPGSSAQPVGYQQAAGGRGFTLIELVVVVALIAIASALVSLALRDPASTRLEQEAVRLTALLEAARADARGAGLAAYWQPEAAIAADAPSGFRFMGLPGVAARPMRWLSDGVTAEIIGARAVALGPEPVIGAQRIVLRLQSRELSITTDGLAAFTVAADEPATLR